MMTAGQAQLYLEGKTEAVLRSVKIARGFLERLIGLLGRSGLEEGEALMIPDCGSVHTFGMRFVIDVLFFDKDGNVLALYPDTPSGYVLTPRLRDVHTLETTAGFISRHEIKTGDKLILTAGNA